MVAHALAFDPTTQAPPFRLSAGPHTAGELHVLSFRGKEAISKPFRFDVTITARHADAASLEGDLLGQPACLTLEVSSREPRAVHGLVALVEARGVFEQGRHAFRVRLVPALWLIRKRKTSRVFQDKTVPEIVGAVLEQARVSHRWALLDKYPPRTYCVQHQETDFAFVTRLLAEEGIFYFFDYGAGDREASAMVLSDSAHLYPAIEGDGELAFRSGEGCDGLLPEEHHVQQFALRRAVQPIALVQRDYDFRRPALDLSADATSATPLGPPNAPSNDPASFELERCRVYEHHGEDEAPDVDCGAARVRLEQHRRRAQIATGESACRRLLPGHRFALAEHDVDAMNQGYVVARIEHVGRAPEVAQGREKIYENSFECAPVGVPLRPKRPAHRLQQVTETAIVVGPKGQEIHTDEHGRVKVQFHWDLEGKRNEHSSCWIRVVQPWAGSGWGMQFIPRVGMEVAVTFLGGDIDRPMIVGALYNGANATPYPLPAKKTQSGIRTRSTPGGAGSNELRFEDASGREQIYVHAQRDLDEVVGNDHTRAVRGEEAIRVGKSRTLDVAGDHVRTVHGNEVVEIAKNLVMHICGRQIIQVDGAADDGAAERAAAPDQGDVGAAVLETSPVGHDGPRAGGALDADEGSGSGRGGGGAKISEWSNKGDATKMSMLEIAGGAIINSPDGLTLIGQGGSITISDGTITLKADKIRIEASGEAQVVGHPIKLN